jgi:uncharacterized protein YdaU (DUF1376 family)
LSTVDFWMPVYIGDYLADTMHLSTEQHGAYLLLIFHLWRRGTLPDEDGALKKITGLSAGAWANSRPVLAEFFKIQDGQWRHGRVERERLRVEAKQEANTKKARSAANKRWGNASSNAPSNTSGNASSIAQAMPGDAEPEPQPKSKPKLELSGNLFPDDFGTGDVGTDSRHSLFRSLLGEYWRSKNHASPEMPWQGRDAKALSDFLDASPSLSESQFRELLANRARSVVAHGDRVYLWIANLTRYQEEINAYNKPASAGGSYASRAEINRDSVLNSVDRAAALYRQHADRVGEVGAQPAAFDDAGSAAADGAGPDGRALALPGTSDHWMAAGHAPDGETGADGPLPYCAATAVAG